MNRVIPFAGALAAALGSMLSLGPAQAATSGICYFNNAGGTLPGTSCTDYSIELGDKRFTVLQAPTTGAGDIEWTMGATDWQTDIDWGADGLLGEAQGSFSYLAEIFTGPASFNVIGLGSQGFEDPDFSQGETQVTKTIADVAGNTLATLSSIDGGDSNVTLAGGYTKLAITDSWFVPEGNRLDAVVNYETQKVPGPLPVLGAIAALGMSRQLRRRLADANG